MIFSENRGPLFRIMHWRKSLLALAAELADHRQPFINMRERAPVGVSFWFGRRGGGFGHDTRLRMHALFSNQSVRRERGVRLPICIVNEDLKTGSMIRIIYRTRRTCT